MSLHDLNLGNNSNNSSSSNTSANNSAAPPATNSATGNSSTANPSNTSSTANTTSTTGGAPANTGQPSRAGQAGQGQRFWPPPTGNTGSGNTGTGNTGTGNTGTGNTGPPPTSSSNTGPPPASNTSGRPGAQPQGTGGGATPNANQMGQTPPGNPGASGLGSSGRGTGQGASGMPLTNPAAAPAASGANPGSFLFTGNPPAPAAAALPDVIPGYQVDILDAFVPDKIKAAVKAGKYIPLSLLSKKARRKELESPSGDLSLQDDGNGAGVTLVSKPLSRSNERLLSEKEWGSCMHTYQQLFLELRPTSHIITLDAHVDNIRALSDDVDWQILLEYDIRQRERSATNLAHDMGKLDTVLLSLLTSHHIQLRLELCPDVMTMRSCELLVG